MGAVVADTDRALSVVTYVAAAVPSASPLDIRVVTGADAAAGEGSGDVQLRLDLGGHTGNSEPTSADLLFQGPAGPRLVASALPWNELPQRLARLVKVYQVERCGRDTFRTWVAGLSVDELRERLGLAVDVAGAR